MARAHLKISVPKPCSESWAAMTPEGKGRHCASCATTVVDFTKFTDKEILEYFSTNNPSNKICGRFFNAQLNRPLILQNHPNLGFFSKIAAIVALFSSFSHAQAQVNSKVPNQAKERNVSSDKTVEKDVAPRGGAKGGRLVISGRLIDESTGEPIPFGNVLIKQNNIQKGFSQSSIEGIFSIEVSNLSQQSKIIIEAPNVGYITKLMELKLDSIPSFLEVKLEVNNVDLPSYQIVSFGVPLIAPFNENKMVNGVNCPDRLNYYGNSEMPQAEREMRGNYFKKIWLKIKGWF